MPRKCLICNQIINEDDPEDPIVPYKSRYAHERCFNNLFGTLTKQLKDADKEKKEEAKQQKHIKPQIEISAPVSEEEYAEKKQYYDYLRTIVGQIEAKHYAMTERLVKQYSFTFNGMYNTLKYLVEIKDKTIEGNVIGLIPYYYDEVLNYLDELDQVEQANENKNIKKMYQKEVVKISKKGQNRKKPLDF